MGELIVCATPIGNLGDISDRVRAALASADVIAAEDTRRTLQLLNHLALRKPLISYYQHNRMLREDELLERARRGERIALVSDAGMPCISDPGEELVRRFLAEGVPCLLYTSHGIPPHYIGLKYAPYSVRPVHTPPTAAASVHRALRI